MSRDLLILWLLPLVRSSHLPVQDKTKCCSHQNQVLHAFALLGKASGYVANKAKQHTCHWNPCSPMSVSAWKWRRPSLCSCLSLEGHFLVLVQCLYHGRSQASSTVWHVGLASQKRASRYWQLALLVSQASLYNSHSSLLATSYPYEPDWFGHRHGAIRLAEVETTTLEPLPLPLRCLPCVW